MKIKEVIKSNAKYILMFICIALVALITIEILINEITQIDVIGYNLISKYLISDNVTPVIKLITRLGGATVLIIVSIILLLTIKNKRLGHLICLNLVTSALLNQILKNIIQRPRPIEFRIIDEIGYSFPSGHSMVSAAFYGYLIYLIYKNIKNKYFKWSLILVLSVLIVLIGASRIYLGVHYTTDVLAGFLIAISYLIIFTAVTK